MKRIIFAGLILTGLILTFLQGCVSSPGKRYYQLATEAGKDLPALDKVLLVKAVDVEPVYNDYRLVYRLSPYELNYYSYQFWVKKPGPLVRDAMVEYLSRSGCFEKVITRFLEGEPHYMLKAKVKTMEEYDRQDAWFARLAMEIEVSTLKEGKVILLHSFDRRKQLSGKKVEKLPMALSVLLEEELTKVVHKLAQKEE